MLNLKVAMTRFLTAILSLAILFLVPPWAAAQETQPTSGGVKIDSPLGGEAIQGQVVITGSTALEDFFSAELSFAYTDDPRGTWFLIDENFNPVVAGPLAEWDTFLLTDGNYDLRLVVTLVDGSKEVVVVEGLRVRNYTQVETSTPTSTPLPTATGTPAPTPLTPTNTPTITPTPTSTPIPPTTTPLPPNPAQLSAGAITNGFLRGIAGAFVSFLLLGIYLSIRIGRRR